MPHAAVMDWQLPERVKRLALPSYRYNELDLDHLEVLVAGTADGAILGVAACEPASPAELPAQRTGLLLHGIYVQPGEQGQGIGRLLLQAIEALVRQRSLDGLLVRAQPDARGFFEGQGMTLLDSGDPARNYQYRYWKPCA